MTKSREKEAARQQARIDRVASAFALFTTRRLKDSGDRLRAFQIERSTMKGILEDEVSLRQRTAEEIERDVIEDDSIEDYSTFELAMMIAPVELVAKVAVDFVRPVASKAVVGLSKAFGRTLSESKGLGRVFAVFRRVKVPRAAADPLTRKLSTSAKGLRGKEFEEYLVRELGGEGSFKVINNEFDGKVGNIWYEAKTWDWSYLADPEKWGRFTSKMGNYRRIAQDNGATHMLFSNTPIPPFVKQWLTKKGMPFREILD